MGENGGFVVGVVVEEGVDVGDEFVDDEGFGEIIVGVEI